VVAKDAWNGAVVNMIFPFVLLRFLRLERYRDSDRDTEMRPGSVVCQSGRYKLAIRTATEEKVQQNELLNSSVR
jgi:hypothetical protein